MMEKWRKDDSETSDFNVNFYSKYIERVNTNNRVDFVTLAHLTNLPYLDNFVRLHSFQLAPESRGELFLCLM